MDIAKLSKKQQKMLFQLLESAAAQKVETEELNAKLDPVEVSARRRKYVEQRLKSAHLDAVGSVGFWQNELEKLGPPENKYGRGKAKTAEERLIEVEQYIQELKTYNAGELGHTLGEVVTAPCVMLRPRKVAVTILKVVLGPRPKKAECICFRCGNENCIEKTHVHWGTKRDNVRDAVLRGKRGRSYQQLLEDAEAERMNLAAQMRRG